MGEAEGRGFTPPTFVQAWITHTFTANVFQRQDLRESDHSPLFLVVPGCGGSDPGQILDKSAFVREGDDGLDPDADLRQMQLAYLGATLSRARLCLQPRGKRKGPRTKAEIEQERREKWERTCREVDEVYADYLSRFPQDEAKATGVVYARFSTRFQDSIVDQVRTNLEHALALRIIVPRDFVFFDLAMRGFKKQRNGLGQVEAVLKAKRAQVLLLFSTSRLFRKQYRTLEFVDRIHKGFDIRCIFVKSGVDTNDKQRWETMLAVQSMIDQFVVTMYVANIHSAHEGLLSKQLVFGTLSFGYGGQPIDGEFTRRKKPRCRIIVDEVTGPIVKQVFAWYVGYWDDGRPEERLSINEIVRRLNDDETIPLPPRCLSEEWTRLAVRRILTNTRYRALWMYGVTESVYLPDGDYIQQRLARNHSRKWSSKNSV